MVVYLQIIDFNRVFHYFHHPFWDTTIFGNTHIVMWYELMWSLGESFSVDKSKMVPFLTQKILVSEIHSLFDSGLEKRNFHILPIHCQFWGLLDFVWDNSLMALWWMCLHEWLGHLVALNNLHDMYIAGWGWKMELWSSTLPRMRQFYR